MIELLKNPKDFTYQELDGKRVTLNYEEEHGYGILVAEDDVGNHYVLHQVRPMDACVIGPSTDEPVKPTGEVEQRVNSYEVKYYCRCGEEMTFTGRSLMSYPPQYPHKCDTCGSIQNLKNKYPMMKWK